MATKNYGSLFLFTPGKYPDLNMATKMENFVENTLIAIKPFITIFWESGWDMGRKLEALGFIFSFAICHYIGLLYVSGILPGQRGRLAYCRQKAVYGFPLFPLTIKRQGVRVDA